MIDIHTHILYDIDDGPEDIYASLRMCETASEFGIDRIISTPHLSSPQKLELLLTKRRHRIERLREEIDALRLDLEIYPGAEVFVNDDIFYSSGIERATLNHSRYLLVEFDFNSLSPSRLIKYIDEIFNLGCVPVVAHPERYRYLQRDYGLINHLVDKGALFQVNAGSLASLGSREEFEIAYQMVRSNAASFIATDAHSHSGRSNDLLRMIRFFPPDISRQSLDFMLYAAPQAVLENRELPPVTRRKIVKRTNFR